MSKPLHAMSASEFKAFTDAIDEQPVQRAYKASITMKRASEYRSHYGRVPTLFKGPKPLQARPKKRGRTTAEIALQLDEMAVRAQAQDRRLKELGLL